MVDNPTTEGNGKQAEEVAFDYIKSQYFRVVHADGVIGGPTPQGFLHITFYSERPPLPRRVVHQVTSEGVLGAPIPGKMVVRDALIREMDIDVIMKLEIAELLHHWLGERIAEIKKGVEPRS